MRIDIVADDDPRIHIEFSIPVKGSEPVEIRLPRFDYIDEDELDAIQNAIESIDADMAPNKAQRQAFLIQMKPFCDSEQFAALEALKLGQLSQIMDAWTKRSAMSLGEYLASVDSSTESTEKPSKRTSSRTAGGDST